VVDESTGQAGAGSPRRLVGALVSAVWLIGALVIGWLLWPSSLGGCTTLTIVSGKSMEPTYSTGDLVVSRCGPVEVGDVIVYNPPDVGGARVIHRIVDGDAGGWIVKGDNNSFLDPWQPTEDQILGSAVLHLPHVGKFAAILLSPLTWISLLIIALAVVIWPGRDGEDDEEQDGEGPGPELDARLGLDPDTDPAPQV
jgi:signal peptidase I